MHRPLTAAIILNYRRLPHTAGTAAPAAGGPPPPPRVAPAPARGAEADIHRAHYYINQCLHIPARDEYNNRVKYEWFYTGALYKSGRRSRHVCWAQSRR